MIRQLAILAVAVICLAVSTRAVDIPETSDIEAEQKVLHHYLSHYYSGTELKSEYTERVGNRSVADVISAAGSKWREAIKKLEARIKTGMLPRHEIFSVYYPYQLDEAILIFNVFYWAPTILHLLWAIIRYFGEVNENQFRYALSVALIHRKDTQWFPIIEPYEIYPEYFFNSDVMKRIFDEEIGHCGSGSVGGAFSVEANYTHWYAGNPFDRDMKLTYFMEDISLNSWYYYFNQRYPFWMSSEEYPDVDLAHRGEWYYYIHKMFLNRYYMERLSHGMGSVDFPDWNYPILEGYSPSMNYKNGLHFPGRPSDSKIPPWKYQYMIKLQQFEDRVAEAATSGVVVLPNGTFTSIDTPEGFEIFANLVQGNNDSYNRRVYGSIDSSGRNVLGFNPEPHNWYQILPSALEHFSTSLRDPAFYRLYTRIINYFFEYKKHLGFYTPEELEFKAVTINNVTIPEKLFTYFEQVGTTIPSYWLTRKHKLSHDVTVLQQRLNHENFTYHFDVTSTENVNVSVRVFLGPEYDVHGKKESEKYKNFYQADSFVTELKEGHNVFERKSSENPWLAPDYTTRKAFHYITKDAEKLAFESERFGFPARLLMPRGTAAGLPVEFFIYISKFVEDEHAPGPIEHVLRDNKPLGFPLDRPIYNFDSSNMYLLKKSIYHGDESTINLTTN